MSTHDIPGIDKEKQCCMGLGDQSEIVGEAPAKEKNAFPKKRGQNSSLTNRSVACAGDQLVVAVADRADIEPICDGAALRCWGDANGISSGQCSAASPTAALR